MRSTNATTDEECHRDDAHVPHEGFLQAFQPYASSFVRIRVLFFEPLLDGSEPRRSLPERHLGRHTRGGLQPVRAARVAS